MLLRRYRLRHVVGHVTSFSLTVLSSPYSPGVVELQEPGSISGLINFHCILQMLELDTNGADEAYGEVFSTISTIGFSTCGEEYLAYINQTSTILVFKGSKARVICRYPGCPCPSKRLTIVRHRLFSKHWWGM